MSIDQKNYWIFIDKLLKRNTNLSKLACYFSYIPARVVVAMQRHQII